MLSSLRFPKLVESTMILSLLQSSLLQQQPTFASNPNILMPADEADRDQIATISHAKQDTAMGDSKDLESGFGPYDQRAIETLKKLSENHVEKPIISALEQAIDAREKLLNHPKNQDFKPFTDDEIKYFRTITKYISDNKAFSQKNKLAFEKVTGYVNSDKFKGTSRFDQELAVLLPTKYTLKFVPKYYKDKYDVYDLIIQAKVDNSMSDKPYSDKERKTREDALWNKLRTNPTVSAAFDLWDKTIIEFPTHQEKADNAFNLFSQTPTFKNTIK